jgi:hypothetical protein
VVEPERYAPRLAARDPATRGFVVIPRRWVVERSSGWLAPRGGLARDRAGRLAVAASRPACTAPFSGVAALLNRMPIRD